MGFIWLAWRPIFAACVWKSSASFSARRAARAKGVFETPEYVRKIRVDQQGFHRLILLRDKG
jgi:hypothetical protein